MNKWLKRGLLFIGGLIFTLLLTFILVSRFVGFGIKNYGDYYTGYNKGKWHFHSFREFPVKLDGPYVFNENGNRYALNLSGNGVDPAEVIKTEVSDQVLVKVDNEAGTQFVVPLRDQYERSVLSVPTPEKLFTMSDLEGEFDVAVNLLKANGVINDSLDWTYGKGHLVLIGDMVDRGENVVPLLWLMYKLEGEAKAAGGDLHYVLGNHEQYMLNGMVKSAADKYKGTYYSTNLSQAQLWSSKTELGQWLRSKPVALKVGSTLFMHAGMSPEFLDEDISLEFIDKEAEAYFYAEDFDERRAIKIISDRRGVLFYRGLAKDMTKYELGGMAEPEHVKNLVEKFDVKRVAIGHTLAKQIGYDYDGKVIRVDVLHSEGISEGLLVENEELYRVDNKGQRFELEKAENYTD